MDLVLLAPCPQIIRKALCCLRCSGFIGPHCAVAHGSWRCGLCGEDNRSHTLSAGLEQLRSLQPELRENTVEYLLSGRAPASTPPPASACLFLIDQSASADALADVVAATRDAKWEAFHNVLD